MYSRFRPVFPLLIALFIFCLSTMTGMAQDSVPTTPLTSQEFVRLVYQLPKHPEQRDEIIDEIRKRGIGFQLTDGMRSLVATKSGSDATLRRTLEEAERRRSNPKVETLPSETEANELLALTKTITLGASGAMPDFVVRQLIKRSVAYGNTANAGGFGNAEHWRELPAEQRRRIQAAHD